ncbi:MAG: tetratricopeptide repeat-containing protein [Bifidobacteriaceae bacterium]|nr:tetratricopeptide repeat-containing protein [Bifidobacteriaceae bacterium]
MELARSPWLRSGSELEAATIGRATELAELVEAVMEAATGQGRRQILVTGPAGSGKTHLLALAWHRLAGAVVSGHCLRLVRLPEDPWRLASHGDLLGAILAGVLQPDTTPPGCAVQPGGSVLLYDAVRPGDAVQSGGVGRQEEDQGPEGETQLAISPDRYQRAEAQLTQLALDRGPVVVLAEAFDQILKQIGSDGQRHLERFLSSEPSLVLVGSSRLPLEAEVWRSAALNDQLDVRPLEPLTVEQVAALIGPPASAAGAAGPNSPSAGAAGTSGLEAVGLLAGRWPGLWVALARTCQPNQPNQPNQPVSPAGALLSWLSDQEPLRLERLRQLTHQQRLVVSELAAAAHPLHVRELARRCGIGEKSVARVAVELKRSGWINAATSPWDGLTDGRRSYYELSDPVTRLVPVPDPACPGLVVTQLVFLELWTGADQLTASPRRLPRVADLLGQVDAVLGALTRGEGEPLFGLPSALRSALAETASASSADPKAGLEQASQRLRLVASRLAAFLANIQDDAVPQVSSHSFGQDLRQVSSADADHLAALERALPVLERILGELDPGTAGIRADLITAYEAVGRRLEAVALAERSLDLSASVLGENHPDIVLARRRMSAAYGQHT